LKKKAAKIKELHLHLSGNEIAEALEICNQDEEEVCIYFTEAAHLHEIRKKIALKNPQIAEKIPKELISIKEKDGEGKNNIEEKKKCPYKSKFQKT